MSTKRETIIKALVATYACMSQDMPDAAIEVMENKLRAYPEPLVLSAIDQCLTECRKMALSDILDRIQTGHPGVEEAWAICYPSLYDEGVTCIRTPPMEIACGVAWALRDDKVAARMAFKESYAKEVNAFRQQGLPITWAVSPGYDVQGRIQPIRQAVADGKITEALAKVFLLPEHHEGITTLPDFPERITKLIEGINKG